MNADSLTRRVRFVRKKNRNEPDIPIDNSFVLPDDYKRTSNGDFFLISDNEDDAQRIIIFGADWALDLLETSDHWGVSH